MDFNYLILTVFMPVLSYIILLYFISRAGEYPVPLPHSENPRKECIETVVYTLLVILYFVVDVFVLNQFADSFYITLCFRTIIFFIVPFVYVHYRNHWTKEDLGFLSKVKSREVVIVGILFYIILGFYNSLTFKISWHVLLIFFYSNAFLEEFLFRAVIQSKLERAFGQKKAIIFQALLFMLIHIPVNIFNFLLDGNFLRLFTLFGTQLLNGIILGLIFLKTRNIWMSVICHYLNNWLGAIITLLL